MPAKNIPLNLLVSVFPEWGSPLRIKYKDVFDMKGFYENLKEWLLDHGWADEIEKNERWESYYGERIGMSGAKELWIQWHLFKKPTDAPFLGYYLDIYYHVLGMTDTEIIHAGRKIKTNKGEVEISIKAFVHKKYEAEFQRQGILREFLPLWNKRIYRKELEQRKKELYQEVYVLQNFIKQWFKLKRYLPYEDTMSFYPSAAFPSHIKEQ